jgi:hypothetical protein
MDGGKKWPAACWVGERKERKGKQNKTKSWPAARGWVGEKEKREKKKKKKKSLCVPAGWVGERKEREKEKINNNNKKGLLCTWLGGRKKWEGRKK